MDKIYSIITPTYNAETTIEATIQSILNQDTTICEHIIIDGGSIDKTMDIVKKYNLQYPDIIKFVSESDKGIYDAMNKGIMMASGVYLNFQGSGDTLKENILESITKHLTYQPEVLFGHVYLQRDKRIVGKIDAEISVSLADMPHQGTFYHKEIFNIVGKYDIEYKITADYILNILCLGHSQVKKVFLQEVIANYLQDGMSEHTTDRKFWRDLKNTIQVNLGDDYVNYFKLSGVEWASFITYAEEEQVVIIGEESKCEKIKNKITQVNAYRKNKIDIKAIYNLENTFEGIENLLNQIESNTKIIIAHSKFKAVYKRINNESLTKLHLIIYQDYLLDKLFMDFISDIDDSKGIYIFGAGECACAVLNYIKEDTLKDKVRIIGILDNDINKKGKNFEGYKIEHINNVDKTEKNYYIIASMWKIEIANQLIELGIDKEFIINATY